MVVLGIGDGLESRYIECITEVNDGDLISIDGFSNAAFDAIMDQLSGHLCAATTSSKPTTSKPITSEPTMHPTMHPTNRDSECSSGTKLDVLFGVDTSGSIGHTGFQIQKEFIEHLVTQEINNGSRIGFFMFNTNVNKTRSIQFWDHDDLILFVRGLYWTGGWTNTEQLMTDALAEFSRTKDHERQQLFVILTDGNPCLPDSQGGCPLSICPPDVYTYYDDITQAGNL